MRIRLELCVGSGIFWINENYNMPVPSVSDYIKVTEVGNLLRVVSVCFMYNLDTKDRDGHAIQTIRLLCDEVLNENSN